MIEGVESIHANLKLRLFGEVEVLAEGDVGVPETWTSNGATSQVARPDGSS